MLGIRAQRSCFSSLGSLSISQLAISRDFERLRTCTWLGVRSPEREKSADDRSLSTLERQSIPITYSNKQKSCGTFAGSKSHLLARHTALEYSE